MLDIGTTFEDALVETCVDDNITRPRVRAIHTGIPTGWRVEFPRATRKEHPIGTQFRCNLKVCQKHNKNGSVRGQPYLFADTATIVKIDDYSPKRIIHAILNPGSLSERSYSYIEPGDLTGTDLDSVRRGALEVDPQTGTTETETTRRTRSDRIRAYVRIRANGACECCGEMAPFITRNGIPYLEVHHIEEISKGGDDSIFNAAAICPNCHSEITHGIDGASLNHSLKARVEEKEPNR